MHFAAALHTETGPYREKNEDSMLLMQADSSCGQVVMACVCDGMGGLERGEAASAAVVRTMRDWFAERLPGLLAGQSLLCPLQRPGLLQAGDPSHPVQVFPFAAPPDGGLGTDDGL